MESFDTPTLGALILMFLTVVVTIFRNSIPTVVSYFKSLQKNEAKKLDINSKRDETETNLSLAAKEYLTRIAQESIDGYKTETQRLTEEIKRMGTLYHSAQIELAELKTKDNIRLQLIMDLQNDLEESRDMIREIPNMQVRLATFESQIKQLENVIDLLKQDKAKLETHIESQRRELGEKDKLILTLENQRVALERRITELEKLNIEYRLEIERYKGRGEK